VRAVDPAVGDAAFGEPCDACAEPTSKTMVEIEGPLFKGAVVKFHVQCFTLWQTEREAAENRSMGPRPPAFRRLLVERSAVRLAIARAEEAAERAPLRR
jgi:hypothetical protein